ncbi:AP2 domain-containing protein [Acidithiobacillus sp.]|uniref:AP2 domain-containing protein n=1 Tax=Acidithiobacillus sp. TaxID=1872118 RepID=UPI003457D87E
MGRDLRGVRQTPRSGTFAVYTLWSTTPHKRVTLATHPCCAEARNCAMPATLIIAQDAKAAACLPESGAE